MPDIARFHTPAAVAEALADQTVRALRHVLDGEPRATLCLTGGSTPEPAYRRLAGAELPWDRIHLFWTDERCVAPDDPRSNFGMARRALIGPAGVPDSNVHRFQGELGGTEAAAEMERELEAFFGADGMHLDVLHLGMGADGHIASLFPGSDALDEHERRAVSTTAPPSMDVPDRVTLTYPVLNAARTTFLAATGEAKREALSAVLAPGSSLPAARFRPAGSFTLLLDQALADGLDDS